MTHTYGTITITINDGGKEVVTDTGKSVEALPFDNEHTARVVDPESFEQATFRRKNIEHGIDIVLGKLNDADEMVVQSYRFDRLVWGAADARDWLAEKGVQVIEFEPATRNMAHEDGYTLEDIEVFSVGSWNGDKYTDADLEDMVKNFVLLKDTVKAPVKLGHKPTVKGDGQPAMGWVTGLRKEGDKLLATLSNIPEVVYKAIKTGRYKRVSSEIYWNYRKGKNVFKRVLCGLALLGADIPAVSNLKDLEALLSQTPDNTGSFDMVALYTFDVDEAGQLKSDDKEKEMEVKEYQDRIAVLETEGREKDSKLQDNEKEIKEFAEAEDKRKTAAGVKAEADAKETFKKYMDEAVKKGIVPPAALEVLMKQDVATYSSDDEALIFKADSVKEFVECLEKVLDTDEDGNTGSGKKKTGEYTTQKEASAEVDSRVKEYIKENKDTTYKDAMTFVLGEDEGLARTYAGKDD